jgi:hypothetical protein
MLMDGRHHDQFVNAGAMLKLTQPITHRRASPRDTYCGMAFVCARSVFVLVASMSSTDVGKRADEYREACNRLTHLAGQCQ